ncbi:DUF6485 family protein [Sinanaerobacter chloroacetimidivorans]|jgi:hypothetical protein|uniref:Uncharacterized protein n=1 Tax=Sinanaerobacter chloroacetimidivorans TaxID=2818044 RepID=A0A8J7W790_9FIRM|nr:DUF6485 family protein [Sinanaerobacter chloroacetimidivorans]MBR0600348.1 hypothetical protein [Sinanaerobacter chloroacetimidivorans]
MPIRDCMSSSPFCPVNKYEEFNDPAIREKGCNTCVEEGLKSNEIPPCFFCKVDEDGSGSHTDYSMEAFARKVIEKAKNLMEL